MKKTERLNWIIMTLRQRGKMSAAQLAEYMEVSHRTIYRDMDALSQMKVPLVAHEGLHGGYEIDEGYFLPTLRLTEKEILILMLLMKFSEELNMGDFSVDIGALRQKLLEICKGDTVFLDRVLERLNFDVNLIRPDTYSSRVFSVLTEAFASKTCVKLLYHSPHRNETAERTVTPLNLFFADGCWYLAGYCHERAEKRTFRLDRIKRIEATEELMDDAVLRAYDAFAFSPPHEHFKLIMDAQIYEIVRSDRGMSDAKVEKLGDGTVCVTLMSNRHGYFERLAFENVNQVTLLEPSSLVEKISKKFIDGAKKYSKP